MTCFLISLFLELGLKVGRGLVCIRPTEPQYHFLFLVCPLSNGVLSLQSSSAPPPYFHQGKANFTCWPVPQVCEPGWYVSDHGHSKCRSGVGTRGLTFPRTERIARCVCVWGGVKEGRQSSSIKSVGPMSSSEKASIDPEIARILRSTPGLRVQTAGHVAHRIWDSTQTMRLGDSTGSLRVL